MNSTHAHRQFILSTGFGSCKATPINGASWFIWFPYPVNLDTHKLSQIKSHIRTAAVSTSTRIHFPTFPYQKTFPLILSFITICKECVQIQIQDLRIAFSSHRRWISRYFMCNYVSSDHIEFFVGSFGTCISTHFLIIFANARTPQSSSQFCASTAQLCAKKYSEVLMCIQILWNVCLRCPRINWESFSMCRERTLKRITWNIQKRNVSEHHFDSFVEQFWGFLPRTKFHIIVKTTLFDIAECRPNIKCGADKMSSMRMRMICRLHFLWHGSAMERATINQKWHKRGENVTNQCLMAESTAVKLPYALFNCGEQQCFISMGVIN